MQCRRKRRFCEEPVRPSRKLFPAKKNGPVHKSGGSLQRRAPQPYSRRQRRTVLGTMGDSNSYLQRK